jgi:hypothetical protein
VTERSRRLLLIAAVVFSLVAAVQRTKDGLHCLLLSRDPLCAVDVKVQQAGVTRWFGPTPPSAGFVYPPASQILLWPFLGWTTFAQARWIWGVTAVAALSWTSWIVVRESGATGGLERVFVGLWPWAMYASRATLVVGQFGLHLLPLVIVGVLGARREPVGWPRRYRAPAALIGALAKPTFSAPFMPLALFGAPSWRPAILVALGYALLTAIACWIRQVSPVTTLSTWVSHGGRAVVFGAPGFGAYGNVHSWLTPLGLSAWNTPATVLIFALFTWWVYCHRRVDPWILLGVAAIVARVWTYHRIYDDVLLLLPLVAVYRLARAPVPRWRAAPALFALIWLAAMAPGRLFLLPAPWVLVARGAHVTVWLLALVGLGYCAWEARRAAAAAR